MQVSNTKNIFAVLIALVLALSFIQGFANVSAADSTSNLYVGYPNKTNNFSTIQDAVNECAKINPSSESERVTIHIAPGTYRKQLIINTPYISFVNEEPQKGDVVITWYYGIGYKYYSVGQDGYYNADNAAAKSSKLEPTTRWGCTVQLKSKATDFMAENIIFENSFNRYVTSEEIADGVEPSGSQSITYDRTASNADVKSKAATERGAAIAVEGDHAQFLNCSFLGSQDTLYTGNNTNGYFKNCLISGNTDYIFGSGNYVFDNCELNFYGYSSSAAGGYITAAREQSASQGYLFNSCTITANKSQSVNAGYFGRPWRETASVTFLDTKLESENLINSVGWTSMSGVSPEQASFKEYNTTCNGNSVSVSSRVTGTLLSSQQANSISIINYLSSWTPAYMNSSSSTDDSSIISKSGGWFESAYAEWTEDGTAEVYYKEASSDDSSYIKADSELIRNKRVDIPGLKGNTKYNIKVTIGDKSGIAEITTMSFDRTGYAHWNYNDGVGAYNNDGTLKNGVTVLYVNDNNKDSVTFNGKTGLYNILNSSSTANLDVRIIGDVNVPAGARANDGSSNDGSNMLYLNQLENVTIEGVGYDAHLVRWGMEIKRSSSIEIRNLYFYQYPDDAIGLNGGSSGDYCNHIWIHNNSFGVGKNEYAGNGTVDSDKAEGDGSTDIKQSEYVTVSYNYYNGCHKTSLVGGGTSNYQDWITYNHNWFDTTESRNPRARVSHIHMLNNYFSNITSYGVGASYNSKIFSENNYFENTKSPLYMTAMGTDKYSGTIKSYNDVLDNCSGDTEFTSVSSRMNSASISNLVSGGDAYDNFDLDSSKMYLNTYTPQTPQDAKTTAIAYAGRMQNKDYNSGSSQPTNPDNPDNPPVTGDTYVLNADDVALGSYSSDVYVNSAFTIKVNAADAVSVDSGAKSSADGKYSFSNRIKLGGAGNTLNRSIQVNAKNSASLTVYMLSSNATADRTVNLIDNSGNVLQSCTVNGSSLNAYTYSIPSAGSYYITTASSGLYVYYASLTENASSSDESYLKGDLNNNKVINAFDVAMAKHGMMYGFNSDVSKKAADMDENGNITSDDILLIKQIILNK